MMYYFFRDTKNSKLYLKTQKIFTIQMPENIEKLQEQTFLKYQDNKFSSVNYFNEISF